MILIKILIRLLLKRLSRIRGGDSNNLGTTKVVPIENICSDVKRTISLTKLIEDYDIDGVISTINKIKTSKYAQRFVINFDWFLDEKNFLKVRNS